MSNKLIGTSPNQVPSNADLGTLAYQDADNVNIQNLKIGDANLGTTPSAWLTVIKDNDNSGNQVVIADAEGVSAAIRTYSIPGTGGDPAGLILNHYYAISGSGNQYMRYADFVANVGSGAGTTMRFITKNASNAFSTGLQINQDGKVIINSGYAAGNFGMYIQGKGSGVADARALHLRGFGGHTNIGGTGPTLVLQNADGTTNNITKLSFETASNGEAVSINCINTNHSSFYGDMAFNTRGAVSGYSEKLRIKADGNVGIGTDVPEEKLDVDGNIKINGHVYKLEGTNQGSPNFAAGDWINIAQLGYGEQLGVVGIEWSSLLAPSSAHHGYTRLKVGQFYNSYHYGWESTLEVLDSQAHNGFHFSEYRIVRPDGYSNGQVQLLQAKTSTAVTAGSFRVWLEEQLGNNTAGISPLQPVVDNTPNGNTVQAQITTNKREKRSTYGNTSVNGSITLYGGNLLSTDQIGFRARGNTSQWVRIGNATSGGAAWNKLSNGIYVGDGTSVGVNLTTVSATHFNCWNVGNDFSADTFTAPVEGKYLITGSVYGLKADGGGSSSDVFFFLPYINNQQINQMYAAMPSGLAAGTNGTLNFSHTVHLEVGDYVDWRVYASNNHTKIYGDHTTIGAELLH